jgi:hypothetical protein
MQQGQIPGGPGRRGGRHIFPQHLIPFALELTAGINYIGILLTVKTIPASSDRLSSIRPFRQAMTLAILPSCPGEQIKVNRSPASRLERRKLTSRKPFQQSSR